MLQVIVCIRTHRETISSIRSEWVTGVIHRPNDIFLSWVKSLTCCSLLLHQLDALEEDCSLSWDSMSLRTAPVTKSKWSTVLLWQRDRTKERGKVKTSRVDTKQEVKCIIVIVETMLNGIFYAKYIMLINLFSTKVSIKQWQPTIIIITKLIFYEQKKICKKYNKHNK